MYFFFWCGYEDIRLNTLYVVSANKATPLEGQKLLKEEIVVLRRHVAILLFLGIVVSLGFYWVLELTVAEELMTFVIFLMPTAFMSLAWLRDWLLIRKLQSFPIPLPEVVEPSLETKTV